MSTTSKSKLVPIRWRHELLAKIKKVSGGNFSEWVKEACIIRLSREAKQTEDVDHGE